jgi:tetratricopeptide (TPR) repeat protein
MANHSNFTFKSFGGWAHGAALALSLVAAQMLVCPGGVRAVGKTQAIASTAAKPAPSSVKAAAATEAERLYNEAIEFYIVDRYARAFDLGQECCALAPQNARFRAGLAVFASKDRPLLYSLSTAREAARLAPGDANVLTNFGILLQKNGQRADAVDRYKKAENINGKDYRPKLGVAQCLGVDGTDGLLIAERELKAACDTPEDTTAKWVDLGSTYFVLRQYKDATACFSRALKLEPQNYALQALRLRSALVDHDQPTTKVLVDSVLSDKLVDRDVALGLARLPDNEFSPDLKHKLLQICERNIVGQGEFFYQLARNFEAGSHLDMAFATYQMALKAAPGECLYIDSEIGNRLSAGRSDEAVAIWGQSSVDRCKARVASASGASSSGASASGAASSGASASGASASGISSSGVTSAVGGASASVVQYTQADKSVFAHVLNCVGELLQSDSPGIRMVRAKFKNIKCGCRLPVIQFKLISQPGVVFARIEDAKEYPCVIVYDAKKSSSETIFKHVRREDDVIEVISDSPVQSIPVLVQLIQTASDKQDKHIFSLWSFLPPPMELPK